MKNKDNALGYIFFTIIASQWKENRLFYLFVNNKREDVIFIACFIILSIHRYNIIIHRMKTIFICN